MNRRLFLQNSVLGAGAAAFAATSEATAAPAATPRPYQNGTSPWPLCLNTSTIRPASVRDKIRAAAEAGYDAMEIWTHDLEAWVEEGNDLKDMRREIEERGMFVVNTIGLWNCMPEGDEEFKKSLDVTKKRMEMAAAAGSQHIAVLPLPDRVPFDLHYATAKYRELLELGLNEYGIHPAMEFVSVFRGMRRLGEAMAVAIDCDHPKARIIPDTFHLYNGGSGFNGLHHVPGEVIASFHWNDLAEGSVAGGLGDKDRIYPGEGMLPLVETLKVLHENGYRGPLSLELFRQEHWESDPLQVAKDGIAALRRNVEAALT